LLDEPFRDEIVKIMNADDEWAISRVGVIEVRRALTSSGSRIDAASARSEFDEELSSSTIVELARGVAAMAEEVVVETGVRTLDAIHIASALKLNSFALRFLTRDNRQVRAAKAMGLEVIDLPA
jgi:predicted nucleic acid-binding protein